MIYDVAVQSLLLRRFIKLHPVCSLHHKPDTVELKKLFMRNKDTIFIEICRIKEKNTSDQSQARRGITICYIKLVTKTLQYDNLNIKNKWK